MTANCRPSCPYSAKRAAISAGDSPAIVALITFVADQISKYLVVHMLELDRKLVVEVLPPWLQFRMAWNQGVNFGLFASSAEIARWGLIAVALAISAWVWVWPKIFPKRAILQR